MICFHCTSLKKNGKQKRSEEEIDQDNDSLNSTVAVKVTTTIILSLFLLNQYLEVSQAVLQRCNLGTYSHLARRRLWCIWIHGPNYGTVFLREQ